MPRMPDELFAALTSFHREVLQPDMQRMVDGAEARINARFDGFETRVAQRFDALDLELDRVALKFDLMALTARVDDLERRLNELDAS